MRPSLAVAQLCLQGGRFRGRFEVRDEVVRAARTQNGQDVYRDSCVEWFVQPAKCTSYLNLEFNALGVVLGSHVRDAKRTPAGFADWTPFVDADYDLIKTIPCFTVWLWFSCALHALNLL